ncbi:MAG: hypothetical protein TREMPRED_004307 [Tremellales sp. Tagirdzhanova-0007]|nr:MAG: hypothetical protein TREMPRED_004307 [Tremellales sp. Tagirdzhanova-0007]
MAPRLTIPSFFSRVESASPILPTTAPINPADSSRPEPIRTRSANSPSASINNDQNTAAPLTAPSSTVAEIQKRSRANTVSVSMRSARRSPSSYRQGSVSSANRDAVRNGEREDSAAGPVSFDLPEEGSELHDEVVGMLDVIDDHVSTVNHLQNMTNTLIFPQLPNLWTRRPEVALPEVSSDKSKIPDRGPNTASTLGASGFRARSSTVSRLYPPSGPPSAFQGKSTSAPIDESAISSPSRADTLLEIEGDHELDAHVKDVLKKDSKWEKTKRIGRGVWTFVKTPMGAFTAVYGFLVAFWGAAIVLFLLGWIKTGSKNEKNIWVEISSQVENGLFTLTGVGLIPWRVRDTYRMVIIWRRKRLITKLRVARGLAPIEDPNDLPDPKEAADYVSVLSDEYVEQLRYQQEQFAKSQTWYRPHATETHRAFPIEWALWNTILMDGNSFFQCILCGCMWGLNRHTRPAWTTGTLIPCSFLCGIGAAVLIWQGSVRTKKFSKIEEELRAALGVPLAIGGISPQRAGGIGASKPTPMPSTAQSQAGNSGFIAERKQFKVEASEKSRSPHPIMSTPEVA